MPQEHYEQEVYPSRGILRDLLEFIIMLVVVVGVIVLVRNFVLTPYEVPTGSMETTIQVKDRIFSERVSLWFSDPQPGDIVTLEDPQVEGRTLVKRVIATGGQVVDFTSDGTVTVDGVPLDEPYTRGLPTQPEVTVYGLTLEYPFTVPDDCVWVMGDNRTNSADSRYFGPVPADSVEGRVLLRYWPLDRFGALDSSGQDTQDQDQEQQETEK